MAGRGPRGRLPRGSTRRSPPLGHDGHRGERHQLPGEHHATPIRRRPSRPEPRPIGRSKVARGWAMCKAFTGVFMMLARGCGRPRGRAGGGRLRPPAHRPVVGEGTPPRGVPAAQGHVVHGALAGGRYQLRQGLGPRPQRCVYALVDPPRLPLAAALGPAPRVASLTPGHPTAPGRPASWP
jgi:hypothetical protein